MLKLLTVFNNMKYYNLIVVLHTVIYLSSNTQAEQRQIPKAILKRDNTNEQQQCRVPEPLAHGSFQFHARLCSNNEREQSAQCRMVPNAPVPNGWVLYYSCNHGYQLSIETVASKCHGGFWQPALPTSCVPKLNLVTREGWGAKVVPNDTFLLQQFPLKRVIIAHTVTDPCNSHSECALIAQSIQEYQIGLWEDIGYNFLVGGDGSVLEGQGWNHIGAHTINYNAGSICVALIGNFVNTPASAASLKATKALIEYGLASGKLATDYKLYAHCQLIQVASPGKHVFNEIKVWPNWDSMNALRCLQG